MPVLVFKTNVQKKSHAKKIIKILSGQLPAYNITFDLQDCDRILRVEGNIINQTNMIKQVSAQGFDVILL